MNGHKYIGTINYQLININFGTSQWQPKVFYNSPFGTIITLPPMFLSAYGSAGTSLPTTSIYGQEYIASVNFLRQDWQNGKTAFDLDSYIAKPEKNYCVVFQEPKGENHHLIPFSKEINQFHPQLQKYIQSTLSKEN